MLNEHDWVGVVQLAARRDEEAAKRHGEEFYDAYKNLVAQMEEDKKNGISCSYDVGYDC